MSLVFLLCGFMVLVKHPMMMVGSLILFTVLVSFSSYLGLATFWYGNLIMLVILSGVMVVFTYMASLSPNSGFFLDYWGSLFIVVLMGMGMNMFMSLEDQSMVAVKLWVSMDGSMNLFSVVMLFIAMLVVVWTGSVWKGPVRV